MSSAIFSASCPSCNRPMSRALSRASSDASVPATGRRGPCTSCASRCSRSMSAFASPSSRVTALSSFWSASESRGAALTLARTTTGTALARWAKRSVAMHSSRFCGSARSVAMKAGAVLP